MDAKDLLIFLSGIIVNIITALLFYYKLISLIGWIVVIIGSVIFMVITGFQLKIYEISERLKIFETEQKRLNERLKIKEDLDSMRLDIKNIYWILENGKKR